MQAIRTQYKGPTDRTGSRIHARCAAGRIAMPYDHALNPEENHQEAARRLARKLDWSAEGLTSGCLSDGSYAHTFAPAHIVDRAFSDLSHGERESAVDAAARVLRADYWHDVQGVAENFAACVKSGEIRTADDANTWIHETIDGHQRVIYTGQAIDTLRWSDNNDAAEDAGAEVKAGDWSALAFYALRADVLERIEGDGIDVNDPRAHLEPEDDEEDEEEEAAAAE